MAKSFVVIDSAISAKKDQTNDYIRVMDGSHDTSIMETQRDRIAELMFNRFNAENIYLADDGLMALYATNRATGIVLHSGHEYTYSVPYYDGYPLFDCMSVRNFGGKHINEELRILLYESGAYKSKKHFIKRNMNEHEKFEWKTSNYSLSTFCLQDEIYFYPEMDHIISIKEKMGYLSLDYEYDLNENKKIKTQTFELPDGNKIEINKEIFKCTHNGCNKIFLSLKRLNEHVQNHSKPFKCSFTKICNKSFGKKWNLRIHEKTHMKMDTCVKCKFCNKIFE
eukprot:364913_1